MRLNKTIILLVFTLILANISFAADSAILKTTILRYEPIPAGPGEYITVYVQLENIGSTSADKVSIRFKDSYPFSMDSDIDKEKIVGKLNPGQAYVTNFKVRIDDKAVGGSNEIKFEFTESQISNYQEKVFTINVQSREAELNIKEITLNPIELNPGETGKVSIKIKNEGDSSISDISFKMVLAKTIGSTVVDLPFAIKDSVSEKNIPLISSGEEKTINYELISYPDVSPGIYKLPIIMSYFDNTGKEYEKTDVITLIINPVSKIDIIIESSDITKDIGTGEVSIKIVNRGFGDIQFANLKLEKSDTYNLLTSYNQEYLGTIDSDDYESTDFKIKANQNEVIIPVTLEYKDSLNNEHSLTKELSLTLYSSKELGTAKKSNFGTIFVVLIIIVGAVWYYRRKKQHKRK